jgi:hypothetical protein
MKCQSRGCNHEARRFVYRRKEASAKYYCERHGDAVVKQIYREEQPQHMRVCKECGCEFGAINNSVKPH